MKTTANTYFSKLFKKYSVFTVLFVTMLLVTAFYAVDKFNLLGKSALMKNCILIAVGLGTLIYGYFFIKKINTRGITFGDAFIWGVFLALIAYAVYVLVTGVTLNKLIPIIVCEPFTIFFIIYRLFYFDKAETAEHKAYIKIVFKKFTIYIPIICSVLFVGIFYIADNANLISEFERLFNNDTEMKILSLITAGTFALFVFTASAKRTVNFVDFVIYFGLITSVLMAVYSFVFGFDKQKLLVSLISLLLSIIFGFIRLRTFNTKIHRAVYLDIVKGKYEISLYIYCAKLFKKYDIFLSIFIASLLSVITYLTFNFNLFNDLATYKGLTQIAFYVFYGIIALGIIIGLIIVLKNFASIHVNVSDFLIFTGFVSSIFCFVAERCTVNFHTITLIILAAQILITQILLVSRSTEVFVFSGKH